MGTIKTNTNALTQRIESEVKRAFQECKESAEQGKKYVYFTTDRDIQRDVRELLEERHKIFVPIVISRYAPSRPAVEHWAEKSEIKLSWVN